MAIPRMAQPKPHIENLNSEEAASLAQEMLASIADLTAKFQMAARDVGHATGELSVLSNSAGSMGALARFIKRMEVASAESKYDTAEKNLEDAVKVRLDAIIRSMERNRRRDGETDVDFRQRYYRDSQQAYQDIADMANSGLISAAEANRRRQELDSKHPYVLGANDAWRFQSEKEDPTTNGWATVKGAGTRAAQKFVQLGVRYFTLSNPLARAARATFRGGGINVLAGLRALGPWGVAAAGAIGAGKTYLRFAGNARRQIQERENASVFSGLGVGALSSYGYGLQAFGGNMGTVARTSGKYATELGGVR